MKSKEDKNRMDDIPVSVQAMLNWKLAREYSCNGNDVKLTLVEFQAGGVAFVEFTISGVKKSTYVGIWECVGDVFALLLTKSIKTR